MKEPNQGPRHLQASVAVTKLELARQPSYIKGLIHERLVKQAAHAIGDVAITRHDDDYGCIFKMDVYVLTGAELSRLIERRAEAIAKGSPIRTEYLF